jgi:bacterioferritin (cytochrome b1)
VRRNWYIAAILVGIVSIAIAALAMRLSADDEPTTTEWAGSVCSSLTDWRESIVALTDVSGGLSRDVLEEKLDDAQSATDELASELRGLGRPDLEGGAELEAELEATLESLQADYESLKSDAEDALESADSPAGLVQALAGLVPRFQEVLTAAGDAVDELRAADLSADARSELEQAFADAEPCQELRGTG